MTLYKAVISPCSSFASPLQSDTLFGAFCWSWLRLYGEDVLGAFLDSCRAQRPPLIFSNAFPAGTLPLPCGVFDEANQFSDSEAKGKRRAAYRKNKKVKNARYVAESAFLRIISGDRRGFSDALQGDAVAAGNVGHNMVCRESGTVENLDGEGNLFVAEEFFPQVQAFDCYLLSDLPQDKLHMVLELMFSLGIGADKSVGKGGFRLDAFAPYSFPAVEDANGFVALSNFIPKQDDPTNGSYKTLVKYPKLDREFAGSAHPFKKPMLFLKCGAAFLTQDVRPFYGRCIANVSPLNPAILLNACTIAIPARLS